MEAPWPAQPLPIPPSGPSPPSPHLHRRKPNGPEVTNAAPGTATIPPSVLLPRPPWPPPLSHVANCSFRHSRDLCPPPPLRPRAPPQLLSLPRWLPSISSRPHKPSRAKQPHSFLIYITSRTCSLAPSPQSRSKLPLQHKQFLQGLLLLIHPQHACTQVKRTPAHLSLRPHGKRACTYTCACMYVMASLCPIKQRSTAAAQAAMVRDDRDRKVR